MISFAKIYEQAVDKKGEKALKLLLPETLSDAKLQKQSDAFYLSTMCRRVFRAGLKHSMVDDKWPEFEKALSQFEPMVCAMLSEDDIDALMQNKKIIRHRGKLLSIRANGEYIVNKSRDYGSFGHFISSWKIDKTVELWWELKKNAKQMGGMSGPYFLRMVGKDTFLLTKDVVHFLQKEKITDKAPAGKRDTALVQEAFLEWHNESKRPLCEISRIISCTV